MESGNARASRRILLAIVISLLLHVATLFIGLSSSSRLSGPPRNASGAARSRLLVTLTRPTAPLPKFLPPPGRKTVPAPARAPGKLAGASNKQAKPQKMTVPSETARSWSRAERAEMDKFLDGLAARPRPPGGDELAQRALAMARQMGKPPRDEEGDEAPDPVPANGKAIDTFSLEMYFDAFIRKLNRSAAFVRHDPGARGYRKALVLISLNPDGSVKNFRVLRSADQEVEIAYIKNVIDRASPFSAFPPDIRSARDSLSVLMCIFPARDGEGEGFMRSFGAQDCKD
ncbi:MAG: hypothetical protein ACK4ZS_06970 [Sulfurimicrobium sp.]